MTSLTKVELERLVGLSLTSMGNLIKTCGPTVEIQNLMGGLTEKEIRAFQLIDRIRQLPTARTFTSEVLSGKSEKALDNKAGANRIEVEGSKMTTCTALVPVEPSNAMDIQALAVLNQINQCGISKKTAHQWNMASIKATTANICIEGALSILDAFGYKNDSFHLKCQKWLACDLAKEKYFPDLQGRMAAETAVFWFWGGPPTRLKWYQGTLQTLLDDRVLYEINQHGSAKVAELIGTDLKELSNVSKSATNA